MKYGDLFPSRFLKADDVIGEGEKHRIKSITVEEFTDPKTREITPRPVLWFDDLKKGLILNKTNFKKLAKKIGEDSDGWAGKEIILNLEAVEAFGETVDAIRVEAVI